MKGMNCLNKSENICGGYTKVSEDVIIKIAENAVNEIEGVSISGRKQKGIFSSSPVSLAVRGGVAEITVPVTVSSELRTAQCTEQIQSSIKNSVQDMTGIAVSKVNVLVDRLGSKQA